MNKEEIKELALNLKKELESNLKHKKLGLPLNVLYKTLYKILPVTETIINCTSNISYQILLRTLLEISILTAYIAFSDLDKAKEELCKIDAYQRFDSFRFKLSNSYNCNYFERFMRFEDIEQELLSSAEHAYIELTNNNLDSIEFKNNGKKRFNEILAAFENNRTLNHEHIKDLFLLEPKKTKNSRIMWEEIYEKVFAYQKQLPHRKICLSKSSYASWGENYQEFFIRKIFNGLNSSVHALSCLSVDYSELDATNPETPITVIKLEKDLDFDLGELCWTLELLSISWDLILKNKYQYT